MMEDILGPDFPLGGTVINKNDIIEAYKTGHSKVSLKVRGDYEINGNQIIFTSIPYRTYRNKIKEQLTKNADKLEEFIDDFNDESNVGKNRLVFDVKEGIDPEKAVLRLFACSDLQTTLSYNMNFIVDGTPKMCGLLDLIKAYVNHQNNVLIKAAEFDKDKAEKRIHVLEGLIIAVDKIDDVIKFIKSSKNKAEASSKLIDFLSIDNIQAKAILDMRLGKLTKIDKEELINELKEKQNIVIECNKIIELKNYRDKKLIQKIIWLRDNYGDERRTKLLQLDITKEKEKEEIIVPEDVVITLTETGNIKRVPKTSFKKQRRNGKGVKSKNYAILITISTNTADSLFLFSSKGKMYRLLIDKIPQGTNNAKGSNINNLLDMESDEKIIAATSLNNNTQAKYVVFFTRKGLMKKTLLEEYTKTKRSKGVSAIKIKEGDSIANVSFMNEEEVLLFTKKGMCIRFDSKNINAIGKNTSGVIAIKLNKDDEVLTGFPIISKEDNIAIFNSSGIGKKCNLFDISIQGRGGKGLSICNLKDDETLVGAVMVNNNDSLLLSGRNNVICIGSEDVPLLGRNSSGNAMMKGEIVSVVKL